MENSRIILLKSRQSGTLLEQNQELAKLLNAALKENKELQEDKRRMGILRKFIDQGYLQIMYRLSKKSRTFVIIPVEDKNVDMRDLLDKMEGLVCEKTDKIIARIRG